MDEVVSITRERSSVHLSTPRQLFDLHQYLSHGCRWFSQCTFFICG